MNKIKKILISRRTVLKAGAMASFALAIGITPTIVKADTAKDSPKNPNQKGFLYDQVKCINCKSCAKACEETNHWEEGTEWRHVIVSDKNKKRYLSYSCNHCENPACALVCPVVAYTKRDKDGAVIHNREICLGCKYCMYACPYHAPQFSTATGRINKCHFCYERQDAGDKPACVSACPTGALSFGLLTDIRKTPGAVAQLNGMPSPELTKPSIALIPKA
ncbi:MAG: 4Fe-4S dicluster domain-containing protein [Peptococcaceae bacterium]|nr:4Fe-4S dicluster domain-containing protein [Peptococcaceae bacterium]